MHTGDSRHREVAVSELFVRYHRIGSTLWSIDSDRSAWSIFVLEKTRQSGVASRRLPAITMGNLEQTLYAEVVDFGIRFRSSNFI